MTKGVDAPGALAPLGSSSASAPLLGRANRAAYLRAFLHLARHAPRAALVQTVATTLPVLAEAIESAAGFDRFGDEGESAADPDALASGLALASAFLSDDRAREALAAHAERHAGALVSALCRVSVSVSRERGLAMAARGRTRRSRRRGGRSAGRFRSRRCTRGGGRRPRPRPGRWTTRRGG